MKKILVVEDDAFLANAYRVKLTKASYQVAVAADGDEALSALLEDSYDLIILDLVLPKVDGFVVLSKIKKDPRFSKIPIIVVSNLSQAEDIKKAKSLGASDYIVKTDLSIKEVLAKITSVLGKC